MSLFTYVCTKKKLSQDNVYKKLTNYCHFDYSLSKLISLESSEQGEEFAIFFSKDTIFYKDSEQFHFNANLEFLVQQGYCWEKNAGCNAKAISSENLKTIIHKKKINVRSVQASLLGEYSVLYRSVTGGCD